MEIKKERIPIDELIRIFDEQKELERRSYFSDFMLSIDYTDIDSTLFTPYGKDPVCMKLAKLNLFVKDCSLVYSLGLSDFSVSGNESERFSKVENDLDRLLDKIRDRKMTEDEYYLIMRKTHPIFEQITNLHNLDRSLI